MDKPGYHTVLCGHCGDPVMVVTSTIFVVCWGCQLKVFFPKRKVSCEKMTPIEDLFYTEEEDTTS